MRALTDRGVLYCRPRETSPEFDARVYTNRYVLWDSARAVASCPGVFQPPVPSVICSSVRGITNPTLLKLDTRTQFLCTNVKLFQCDLSKRRYVIKYYLETTVLRNGKTF